MNNLDGQFSFSFRKVIHLNINNQVGFNFSVMKPKKKPIIKEKVPEPIIDEKRLRQ